MGCILVDMSHARAGRLGGAPVRQGANSGLIHMLISLTPMISAVLTIVEPAAPHLADQLVQECKLPIARDNFPGIWLMKPMHAAK